MHSSVTLCTKPVQNNIKSDKIPAMEGSGGQEVLPLAEEILSSTSCCEKENHKIGGVGMDLEELAEIKYQNSLYEILKKILAF